MPRHLLVYYIASVSALVLFTFAPQAQPFVLTELLGIAESEQGVLSGNVSLFAEIVILFSIGAWGVLSDRLGRRLVFGAGFLLMGVGAYLTASVDSVLTLYLYRGVFALGAAAVTTMLATVIADYVVDEDRGKGSGIGGNRQRSGCAHHRVRAPAAARHLPRRRRNRHRSRLGAPISSPPRSVW